MSVRHYYLHFQVVVALAPNSAASATQEVKYILSAYKQTLKGNSFFNTGETCIKYDKALHLDRCPLSEVVLEKKCIFMT